VVVIGEFRNRQPFDFETRSQNCEKRVFSFVRPNGTARFQLDGFPLNLIFEYFSKICRSNYSFTKILLDLNPLLITSRSILLRMRNVSDRVVEKIETHTSLSTTCFRKSYRVGDNVEKYC